MLYKIQKISTNMRTKGIKEKQHNVEIKTYPQTMGNGSANSDISKCVLIIIYNIHNTYRTIGDIILNSNAYIKCTFVYKFSATDDKNAKKPFSFPL